MGERGGQAASAAGVRLSSDDLSALARQYGDPLRRYFLKKGAQPATADDLVQEVLLRIAGRGAGPEIENPEAYLMRAASSVWNDFWRKRGARAHGAHVEFEDYAHGFEEVSPDRVYEGRETVQRVIAALEELDDRPRQIFFLCRFEGMKQREVAERLRISQSLVEKEMMKAIAHLADRFGDD